MHASGINCVARVGYKTRQHANERHVSLELGDYFCIGNEALDGKRPVDDDDDDDDGEDRQNYRGRRPEIEAKLGRTRRQVIT